MTNNQTAYAGITGVASTNIVTVTGATLADGQILTLSAKTGGSGLSLGVGYYIINASGTDGQLSLTPGGSVVALGTNITAPSAGIVSQPELSVWSSEYRDTFASNVDGSYKTNLIDSSSSYSGPGVASASAVPFETVSAQVTINISNQSDEVAHVPLRQTFLKKSFWKFDRGGSASPRYLYAEYMQGDQILDNPPETI